MRDGIRIAVSVWATGLILWAGASALSAQQTNPPATEDERLRQCDRDLCGIVNAPAARGGDLKCDISQTWYKEDIVKAVEKGRMGWPFGDARCSMQVSVSRALLNPAMTEASYKLKAPPQPVRCEVDTEGGRHEIMAKMAPEIAFKSGKATSVSLGVQNIEGNAIVRNVVWAAWKLEATFGFFEDDLLKEVNDYIRDHCPTAK